MHQVACVGGGAKSGIKSIPWLSCDSPECAFSPLCLGETSLHGYHPPESSDCQAEGSEQSSVSRKCKESRPLPVPAAKNRPRPMLFLR